MRGHAYQSALYVKPIYFRALEEIKDELHPISERASAVGYRENDADVQAVCELAENVRDAIIGYQVSPRPQVAPGSPFKSSSRWLNKKQYMSRAVKRS